MAELFLQDLQPEFVARSTDDLGYDFLVGFTNPKGGINTVAVVVKATPQVVPSRFLIKRRLYDLLTHSNIPGLLLVVDVKQNKLYYASPAAVGAIKDRRADSIAIPLTEIDGKTTDDLRKQLVG